MSVIARRTLPFALVLLTVLPLAGQGRESMVADSSPFRPLDLPTPTAARNASGRPGAGYWQQRVDYRIKVALDPATHRLSGTQTIRYGNNSPDVLHYIWLQLEQNICAPESITNQLNQPPMVFLGSTFDFSCQGFAGGGTMTSLTIDGVRPVATRYGTALRVDLARPLMPGEMVELEIAWHFTVPPMGAARMGRDGDLHQIAQFHPRVAVYDDVRGWNHDPYIGAGEFYLEYGSFDVELTVPATWLVAATGTLQNPERVLTATQRERLARALTSDTAIAIVSREEAANPARHRPATDGTLTWHFQADSVRDFAFATGPAMQWDASGYDGILIQTMYRSAATKWREANAISRHAIRHFSEKWYRYPYPHATTVEGPVEGMEYPMLTFVPDSPTREDLFWVLTHEFGHEWFPMLVGSNERFYPWMDEGFNTFMDLEAAANYFAGTAYGDTIQSHPLNLYASHAVPGLEQPMITRPVEVRDLFWAAYQKPALMLSLLRDEVLGRERFEDAFREYIRAWAYRHPTPADFIRIMRDRSGMDLDWFWRGWIYTTARLDQAVTGIRNDGDRSVVTLENRGAMVMPVRLAVRYGDGSTESVQLPVEMWNLGSVFEYRGAVGRRVVSATVDPDQRLPDTDRSNNAWPRR